MFTKLTFSDSGHYECDVTMGPLSRKASFKLIVEGKCIPCWVWLLPLNYLLSTHLVYSVEEVLYTCCYLQLPPSSWLLLDISHSARLQTSRCEKDFARLLCVC